MTGSDVFLQLMETVRALERTTDRHTQQLGVMHQTQVEFRAELSQVQLNVSELNRNVWRIEERVKVLAQNVAQLSEGVGHLGERVGRLEAIAARMEQNAAVMHENAKEMSENVHRMAQLLLASQKVSENRIDELDARVTRLERKAG